MQFYTCPYMYIHAAICDAVGKTKSKLLLASSCCCFVIRNCFGLCAESCFEIGYTFIPRSFAEAEVDEWPGSCTENVNNNKKNAGTLSNKLELLSRPNTRSLSLSLPLSFSCCACQKLRHTISSSFSASLSFSRTSAGKQRIGLATPRPVPLRYTQFQCQGCLQTCTDVQLLWSPPNPFLLLDKRCPCLRTG